LALLKFKLGVNPSLIATHPIDFTRTRGGYTTSEVPHCGQVIY